MAEVDKLAGYCLVDVEALALLRGSTTADPVQNAERRTHQASVQTMIADTTTAKRSWLFTVAACVSRAASVYAQTEGRIHFGSGFSLSLGFDGQPLTFTAW